MKKYILFFTLALLLLMPATLFAFDNNANLNIMMLKAEQA